MELGREHRRRYFNTIPTRFAQRKSGRTIQKDTYQLQRCNAATSIVRKESDHAVHVHLRLQYKYLSMYRNYSKSINDRTVTNTINTTSCTANFTATGNGSLGGYDIHNRLASPRLHKDQEQHTLHIDHWPVLTMS